MKLTVVTAELFNSVNLNGFQKRVQMNTKDLSGIAIVERKKLRNTVGKYSFSWDQKNVVYRESRLIPRKIKETIFFKESKSH